MSITDEHFILGGDNAASWEDLFRRNADQLVKKKDRKEMLEKSECLKIVKAQQYLLKYK